MDSITTEDPKQTEAMTDSEATKSVQAVSKISACEECIARLRATINTSSTGTHSTHSGTLSTSATTESSTAPSTRPATGPRFERRPLPTFKSGELRDYPVFKSDWSEVVVGYFKPSEERRAIRDCVPEEIKPDIERVQTMEEIWKFLDQEAQ